MDLHLLRVFQGEVARQCNFAVIASEDIRRSLGSGDSHRLWYSVQALLVAVANVSKLLWDGGVQRRPLRRSLSVQDSSPLRPRSLRNHLEHFDDRLTKWYRASRAGAIVDGNIGPLDRITGISPMDCLRNFDPATWTLTFRGESYCLLPVIEAVGTLYQTAATEAVRPSVDVNA